MVVTGVALSQRAVEKQVEGLHLSPIAIEKLLKAHRYIAGIEEFRPIGKTKDAGVILNKHFALSNGTAAQDPVWWSNILNRREEKAEIDENWLKDPDFLFDEEGKPKYDDEILSKLDKYDYWEPASSGVLGEYLIKPSRVFTAFGVSLEMAGIVSLAKIRLSRGLKENDLENALQETRQLARLCFGHDSILDSAIGLAILSLEDKVLAQAKTLKMDTSFWKPISQDDIDLARKLLMTSIQFYDPTSNHTSKVFAEQKEIFERCAILGEAGYAVQLLRATSLRERKLWAFEANLLKPVQHFEEDWEVSDCSLPRLKREWNHPNAIELFGADAWMFKIPYARMFLLGEILEMGIMVDKMDNDPLDGLDAKVGL